MKDFFSGYARHLLWGLLIILGGLFIYLVIAIALGHQPYLNRPGSGLNWDWDWSLRDSTTLGFLVRFLLFLGAYLLAGLTLIFILFKLIQLIGYNRIAFRLLGGLVTGLLTCYVTLAIGWYIAISEVTVIVAGVLGLTYGATLFPDIMHRHKAADVR